VLWRALRVLGAVGVAGGTDRPSAKPRAKSG